MRLTCLDLGKKRVGVATANDALGVVIPMPAFVVATTLEAELGSVADLLRHYETELLIVGDPVSLSGVPNASSQWARGIASQLAELAGVAVTLVDERMSTRSAASHLAQAGVRGKKMRSRIDSAAAAVILEQYLARPRSTDLL